MSTVNRPLSSYIFLRTGVVCCQSWLFIPLRSSTRMGLALSTATIGFTEANAMITITTLEKKSFLETIFYPDNAIECIIIHSSARKIEIEKRAIQFFS